MLLDGELKGVGETPTSAPATSDDNRSIRTIICGKSDVNGIKESTDEKGVPKRARRADGVTLTTPSPAPAEWWMGRDVHF